MSYILDALKKSENERQQGKTPGFNTVQPQQPTKSNRRRLWPALLAAAVVLNAAVILVALRPWEPKVQEKGSETPETRSFEPRDRKPLPDGPTSGQDIQREKVALRPSEPAAPAAPLPREAEPPAAGPKEPPDFSQGVIEEHPPVPPAAAPSRRSTIRAEAGPNEPRFAASGWGRPSRRAESAAGGSTSPAPNGVVQPRPATRPADVREKSAEPASTPPAGRMQKSTVPSTDLPAERRRRGSGDSPAPRDPSSTTELAPSRERPPQEQTIPGSLGEKELHNMPAAVRDGVPKLTFSFLVYSDRPEERMITINGKRLREGEEVSSGLRLEEITKEGAVLSWKGQRFHKSVF